MRLLVVEDDKIVAVGIRSFLRRQPDFTVDLASDGAEALDAFEREAYQIVIVDWNLPPPGPSGIELCRLCRARSHSIGILFATARESVEDRLRAFDAGADDYLVKPLDPRELVARLRALSRRSRATACLTGGSPPG